MDIIENVYNKIRQNYNPILHTDLNKLLVSMLLPQIKNIEINDELVKERLIKNITDCFNKSSIQINEPVGVNASLVIGENNTQSSLSSKHSAGLKKGATGFERIKQIVELIDVPHTNIIPSSIRGIPRPRGEVYELANIIEYITIHHLKPKIYTVSENHPYWYKVFLKMPHSRDSYGISISESQLFKNWLRIEFDREKLYKHRISIYTIANSVQDELTEQMGIVIPCPAKEGTFIDIHNWQLKDKKELLESIIPRIMPVIVSGLTSVTNSHIVFENLLKNITIRTIGENTYEFTSTAPAFIPPYAWSFLIKSMIPDAEIIDSTGREFKSNRTLENIKHIIFGCPIMYADVIKDKTVNNGVIRVTFKEELVNEFPYLEYADLRPKVFLSEQDYENYLLEYMVDYHIFWYIEADCTNISDLYVQPIIDPMYTFSLSPKDTIKNIGYLAMRQLIYNSFKDNIKISPEHIKLITNNITLYKNPVAEYRSHIPSDRTEFLTFTTFEMIFQFIISAAFSGEVDKMQSVTSQILSGGYIPIGRGGHNLPSKENKFISLLKKKK